MNDAQNRSYLLPAEGISSAVRDSLHPWIQGFIGLTPIQATQRLHERWSTIQSSAVGALANTLSSFEVREIVDCECGGMIMADRQGSEKTIGNHFYLPGPLEHTFLRSQLEAVSLSQHPTLTDFLTHFAGLAEDISVSGDFIYSESPWPTFTNFWNETIADFDEWEGSLVIYNARNGCSVLVHPSGRVAWWVLQEHDIKEIADDFHSFLIQFNEHRKLAWPFDPYGP